MRTSVKVDVVGAEYSDGRLCNGKPYRSAIWKFRAGSVVVFAALFAFVFFLNSPEYNDGAELLDPLELLFVSLVFYTPFAVGLYFWRKSVLGNLRRHYHATSHVREFAAENGLTFIEELGSDSDRDNKGKNAPGVQELVSTTPEESIVFSGGAHEKRTAIVGDGNFALYHYHSVVGSGRYAEILNWHVAVQTLPCRVPHIVLESLATNSKIFGKSNLSNSIHKSDLVYSKALSQYFDVYVPEKYVDELPKILNVDVSTALISYVHSCEIEIFEDRLYVYSKGSLSHSEYVQLFDRIQLIVPVLMDGLNDYCKEKDSAAHAQKEQSKQGVRLYTTAGGSSVKSRAMLAMLAWWFALIPVAFFFGAPYNLIVRTIIAALFIVAIMGVVLLTVDLFYDKQGKRQHLHRVVN